MKKWMSLLFALPLVACAAQGPSADNLPAVAGYYYNGTSWTSFTTTGTSGPSADNQPAVGLWGYNATTKQWYPCGPNNACLGGGGGGGGTGTVSPNNTASASPLASYANNGGSTTVQPATQSAINPYLLSPGPIGGSTPNAGTFTTIAGNGAAITGLTATQVGAAPATNPNGGQKNYAPIDSPSLTGNLSVQFQVFANALNASLFVTSSQYINNVTTLSGTTPAINASNGMQTITLSGATTATVNNITQGQEFSLQICQPSSGGPYTFTYPAAIHGGVSPNSMTAGLCSQQIFKSFNGTTLVAMGPGVTNVAP